MFFWNLKVSYQCPHKAPLIFIFETIETTSYIACFQDRSFWNTNWTELKSGALTDIWQVRAEHSLWPNSSHKSFPLSPDVQHQYVRCSLGSLEECQQIAISLESSSGLWVCTEDVRTHTHSWVVCLYVVMKCSGAKRPYLALRCELRPASFRGGMTWNTWTQCQYWKKQTWSKGNILLTMRWIWHSITELVTGRFQLVHFNVLLITFHRSYFDK